MTMWVALCDAEVPARVIRALDGGSAAGLSKLLRVLASFSNKATYDWMFWD